ncbi:putative Senecionine N-oxygenase [Hypsibius exemplaris]|uniref:Flavin-containing monooxygenase n=1 Tax=Hypsibius exemplaris TaxID=2072580 RepID=A0A1W0WZD4_HYPEX|nr:putative Senecionine N-oxygenase [Hypsibius exemplaris]
MTSSSSESLSLEVGNNVLHPNRKRVAILGAGYAGLCALRHFFADDTKYESVAFEQSNHIGGIWHYPEGCAERAHEEPTSPFYTRMYKNMRTNLPKDLMSLEGLPFPRGDASYCDVRTVRQYLEAFAEQFNLREHIKFGHRVTLVTPILSEAIAADAIGPRWTVECEDLLTKSFKREIFDIVLVCTGKYHKPYMPAADIPGLANYKGKLLHSSDYRDPERYAGQDVLIVGAGPSGFDIALDLLPLAKSVIFAKRRNISFFKDQFPTITETTMPQNIIDNGAVLADGSTKNVDAIILCTGYCFNFPFLSSECRVERLADE